VFKILAVSDSDLSDSMCLH